MDRKMFGPLFGIWDRDESDWRISAAHGDAVLAFWSRADAREICAKLNEDPPEAARFEVRLLANKTAQ